MLCLPAFSLLIQKPAISFCSVILPVGSRASSCIHLLLSSRLSKARSTGNIEVPLPYHSLARMGTLRVVTGEAAGGSPNVMAQSRRERTGYVKHCHVVHPFLRGHRANPT